MLRGTYRTLFLTPVLFLLAVGVASAEGKQWVDDPGQLGRYAVGHTNYSMVNQDANNRPVFVSVWYPVDARSVNFSTPPAQYATDPYTPFGAWPPPTFSTDWEAIGYDRAYEGPAPARDGQFPLVMVSPGWTARSLDYIFIGTRLASHGYVVAVLEHWADGQWPWSQFDDLWTAMFNRPRDVSFAITQLLGKSSKRGELLFHAIDPDRIAASGHSLGGYAVYTLAGGDDLVCDDMQEVADNALSLPLPFPENTCAPTRPDPRIKAIVPMDGSSWALHYRELARISVPSLIIGDTVDQSAYLGADIRDWIARPHAAINRDDSYRMDVNGANHYSWTNYCDSWQVFYNIGGISAADLASIESSWPCASTGWFPATISPADAHGVVTKYMVAFLDLYFTDPGVATWMDWWILTPGYALSHKPTVQFFKSERCYANVPDRSYFTYRAYQTSSECDVAQKDPTGWFFTP